MQALETSYKYIKSRSYITLWAVFYILPYYENFILYYFIYRYKIFVPSHTNREVKKMFKTGFIGILIGFANGLFGAGGGIIAVPFLQKFLKVETHKSHATTIAVMLPLSVISALIYLYNKNIDWLTVLYVSIGGVPGGYAGAKLLTKISGKWLHKIFGVFIIAAAVRMIF